MTMDTDDYLIRTRRYLHAHPELSTQEYETAKFIAAELSALGLNVELGAYGSDTSVVTTITGPTPGPTLAWRADIDALPITECTDAPYQSQNTGVMHACGHDVHTTIGLGIVRRVLEAKERLKGSIKFIFQPAEEGAPGSGVVGSEAMAQGGVLQNPDVDAVFALHCMPSLPVGVVGYNTKAMWAGSDLWRLKIVGKQTHAAYPQDGVDPLYVLGHILTGIQSVPARVIDSRECCVISVGQVNAGQAFNIIPEEVNLVGLVRTLDESVRLDALAALETFVTQTCAAFGARAEFTASRGAYITTNNAELVTKTVGKLQARGVRCQEVLPQMGAEDFASFSRRAPGAYFLLGVGNPDRGITHPIHSPHFDVDEACMAPAVDHFAEVLLEW